MPQDQVIINGVFAAPTDSNCDHSFQMTSENGCPRNGQSYSLFIQPLKFLKYSKTFYELKLDNSISK